MLDLYFYPSPNGLKITIMLEECGLPYRIRFVDITRGAQFDPAFVRISPNNKIPALVEEAAAGGPVSLFESGAILQYLAERSGRFLPAGAAVRYRCLAWLFWQVGGLGPMAGQAHHFRAFAPEKVPYAIRRYTDEVNRLYGVLDTALADSEWLAGDYSIADMACYPWIVPHERQGQDLGDFPHIKRWYHEIAARPATVRAYARSREVNTQPTVTEEARKILFGQTAQSAH